ncbi:MAG: S8 family serine peptidase [Bacteroidota bacterium]
MKWSFLIGCILVSLGAWGQQYEAPYAQDKIVVKLRTSLGQSRLAATLQGTLTPVFPQKQSFAARQATTGVGLERIYFLSVPEGETVESLLAQWQRDEAVEYAEPYYLPQLLVVPNDPEAQIIGGEQDYLEIIEAYEGWDVTTGDTTVVVAILDSGTDFDHDDIQGQLAYNYADPVNGEDDDGNGYVDDFAGYDLADGDADATADVDNHGFRVAGFSSATTNNGIGIAGVGYNSRYLPVKIFRSADNIFNEGYEAIVYAADRGAQIINLSWGGTNPTTQFSRDLIDYAVEERDAVIVAAAGNTAAELDFYPASLPNVLSVGATNNLDEKASWATWSPFIDLMAPGDNVYTLDRGNSYRTVLGSSFSAPQVAGAAALIRAYRPHLNADQVRQQLRVSATDIYDVGSNEDYAFMLGRGRLSVVDALVDTLQTAVRMVDPGYTGSVGPYVNFDDTLYITGELVSYLQPWKEGTATLTTQSPYVTLLDSTYSVDSLGTLDRTGQDTLFTVYLHPDLSASTEILFRLDFSGTDYEDFQHWQITSEPPFVSVDNGAQYLTVGDNGNLGYYQDVKTNGIGWMYSGSQLLSHMGLVVALDSTQVADNAVSRMAIESRSTDFAAFTPVKRFQNAAAGVDIRSWFQDSLPDFPVVRIQQRWLAEDEESASPFLVAEYRFVNTGDSTLEGLHVGWLSDWEVELETHNRAGYDSLGMLGYISDSAGVEFAGVAWLSADSTFFTAIDWGSENGNTSDVDTALSDADRFALLTNERGKLEAGIEGSGNDVGLAAGYYLDSLQAGQNRPVAFALVVGNSLEELRDAADSARKFYQAYRAQPDTWGVVEVCAEVENVLDPTGNSFNWYADRAGESLLATGSTFTTGALTQDTVFYIENLDSGYQDAIHQYVVRIREPEARFTLSADTLVLSEGGSARVDLHQTSEGATSFAWDFGEGTQSGLEQPSPAYFASGTYWITLTVTNSLGCVDSLSQSVRVLQRAANPALADQSICYGEQATLAVSGVNALAVYTNANLEGDPVTGSSVSIGPLLSDTTLWVTNQDSVIESLPTEVTIQVVKVGADLMVQPDTTMLNTLGLSFTDQSITADAWTWYVNDVEVGTLSTVYAALPAADSLSVSLLAESSETGCVDSTGYWLFPKARGAVEASTLHVCPGEEVQWNPGGAEVLVFASDAAGAEVLHKGTVFSHSSYTTDTVWVASLEGFVPSTFQPLVARRVSAAYTVDPDQATFQVLDTTHFLASDDLIATHLWQFNEGPYRTENPLINTWLTSGTYEVTLLAIDSLGCEDTLSQTYTVVPRESNDTVTGLPNEWLEDFGLFPNPALTSVTVDWPSYRESPQRVRIVDTQGRILTEKPWSDLHEGKLMLHVLDSGPYWVQLVFTQGVMHRMLWVGTR